MAARRADPVASRAAILAAARRCFTAAGFAGTSMSDIAGAAGVTQSLIHHHFGAKEALWQQVVADAFAEYAARQGEMLQAQGHPRGLLHGSMAAYFRLLRDNPDLLRLMAWAELEGTGALGEIVSELQAQGVARLRAGQAAGLIRDDVAAEHVLAAFQGLVRTWFEEQRLVRDPAADPAATDRADAAYLDAAWSVFARGVLADAG